MKLTATEFSTVEDKEKFIKHFKRFVEGGMKRTVFPKWFYIALSTTFGHIAHYDINGFYDTWFRTLCSKIAFLEHTLKAGCYGSPAFTYSDAEKVIQDWLRKSGIIKELHTQNTSEEKEARHELYLKLKDEFEG